MAQIAKLSPIHEQIALWLMENPTARQGDCATAFGYTQGWLSQIMGSDLFQARLAQYREQGYEVGVLSIRERMAGLALQALEQMTDKLETEEDLERIHKVADGMLKRLGYGEGRGAAVNISAGDGAHVTITSPTPEALQEARAIAIRVKELTPPRSSESDADRDHKDAIDGLSTRIDETTDLGPEAA